MKKLYSLLIALTLCISAVNVNAQCASFFQGGWNGQLFSFGPFNSPTMIWTGSPAQNGQIFITRSITGLETPGPRTFATGAAFIFRVFCGRFYIWQSCNTNFDGDGLTEVYTQGNNGFPAGTMDQTMSLYSATVSGTTIFIGGLVAANDDGCSFFGPSVINYTHITADGFVVLLVTDFFCQRNVGSTFDMAFAQFASLTCTPPANNDVCNALPVGIQGSNGSGFLGTPTPGGSNTPFDLTFATVQVGEPSPGAGTTGVAPSCDALDGWCSFETGVQNSVWYGFIAPPSGNVIIQAGEGDDDSQLAVWESSDCNDFLLFVEWYANDDGGPVFAARLDDPCGNVALTPGEFYFLQVDGFAGDPSSGNLFIQEVPAGGPTANDEPAAAVGIAVGACAAYDNECATPTAGFAVPAGSGGNSCDAQDGWCFFELGIQNDVWYSFVAPASGCVSIATDNSDDLQLAVWNGNTLVAANDDGGPIFAPFIDQLSCLTPGQTYLVQLDGFFGTISSGNLCVTDCGNQPLTCDAGLCQSRYLGYPPAQADTNFLVGSAAGGFPPYTMTWTALGPDMTILYTNQLSNSTLGAAVQPNVVGANCYVLTVTDSHGCVCTSNVCVNVIDLIANCPSSSGSGSATKPSTKPSTGSGSGSGSGPKFKIQICKVCPPPSTSSSSGSGSGSVCVDHEVCVKYKAPKAPSKPSKPAKLTKIEQLLADGSYLGPCNNPCRNSNASFPPPPPCAVLSFDLTADSFGGETSWSITDLNNGAVLGSAANGQVASNSVTGLDTCVDPNHCYLFNIDDSFGDGICCTWGLGAYSLSFNGTTVNSNSGNNPFDDSNDQVTVGNCAAACAIEVCVSTNSFGDEIEYTLTSSNLGVILSDGPVGFGTTTCASTLNFASLGNLTLDFNSAGIFNDNTGTVTVTCGGSVVATFPFAGGSVSSTAISACCGSLKDEAAPVVNEMNVVRVNAYPNPFNTTTTISFGLDKKQEVTLTVYDLSGTVVANLYNGVAAAGTTNVQFNAGNLSSGIYIYRLVAGNEVQHGKVTLAK